MFNAVRNPEKLLDDPFIQHLQHAIAVGHSPLQPVGGRTKSGLISQSAESLELAGFSGIVAYDPSEYLITARAGTSIAELTDALARNGQFLPFDPLFAGEVRASKDGAVGSDTQPAQLAATLGGTIASGISGPDRLLYGGVRDFVMEVAMLDGLGKLVRGGGKVVKNAAGFDIPKMMVGSYGRLGVLVEVTLKVFPTPQSHASLAIENDSILSAVSLVQAVLAKPLPISSVMIDRNHRVILRIAGPSDSLSGVIDRIGIIAGLMGRPGSTVQRVDDQAERKRFIDWLELGNEDELLLRIGLSAREVAQLDSQLKPTNWQYFHAGACSVTWVKIPAADLPQLEHQLTELGLSAVVVRGRSSSAFLGNRNWAAIARQIQRAIDPNGRFVPW